MKTKNKDINMFNWELINLLHLTAWFLIAVAMQILSIRANVLYLTLVPGVAGFHISIDSVDFINVNRF